MVIRACQDFLVRGRRSPLGWLQVLRTNIANIDGLIRLVDAMPNDTTELREVALEVTQAALAAIEEAVAAYRTLAAARPDAFALDLAM